MINITTTEGQPIILGVEMIREISDKGGVSTITLRKGNQTYKTASTLDQIKAQAFKNLFIKVTDSQGVNFLLFAYRIVKVIPSGSGSSIEFNDGTPNKIVTQNAAAIMASFADASSFLAYGGTNGVNVTGNQIKLGGALTEDTNIPAFTFNFNVGALNARAADVMIGSSVALPIASALVNLESTSKGILIPRMTSAQRLAIAPPADGLQVYDTDTNSVWHFDSGNTPTWQQSVSKQYVDAALLNVMRVIGSIDCSTNPNYPAATQGDSYYVNVAGKIGGALGPDVHVGDFILCVVTSPAGDQAAVGTNWIIIEDTTPGNYKGALAASPVSGVAGDWYFNTNTGEPVYYDSVRSKWFGQEVSLMCNRNGNVLAGSSFMIGNSTMTNFGAATTPFGFQVPFTMTITSFSVRRSTVAAATDIRVFKNNNTQLGVAISLGAGVLEDSINTFDQDVIPGDVIGVGVLTGNAIAPVCTLIAKRKY